MSDEHDDNIEQDDAEHEDGLTSAQQAMSDAMSDPWLQRELDPEYRAKREAEERETRRERERRRIDEFNQNSRRHIDELLAAAEEAKKPRPCASCTTPTVSGVPISRPDLVRCDPCAENAKREDRRRHLRFALHNVRIPPRFEWATFDAHELSRRAPSRAITMARRLLDALLVVLVGPSGAGKTSIACAMLRAIIDAGVESDVALRLAEGALFVDSFELVRARLELALGKGEAELVREAFDARVLVLDDVASEPARSSVVQEILHERHNRQQRTILTTWADEVALVARYGDGTVRRILEGAQVIQLGTKGRAAKGAA
jgi:DNA replication protein DnaC